MRFCQTVRLPMRMKALVLSLPPLPKVTPPPPFERSTEAAGTATSRIAHAR
jgi:hypothetical protein